jgi:RNA polymerase sigma factor (sigma-70 family)
MTGVLSSEDKVLVAELYRALVLYAELLIRQRRVPQDANDLASIAIVAMLTRWEALRSSPDFPSLLRRYGFVVVKNAFRQTLREQQRATPDVLSRIALSVISDETVEAVLRNEDIERVRRVLDSLEGHDRRLLEAFASGDNMATLAKRHVVSEPTIRTRLWRALQKLRKQLE